MEDSTNGSFDGIISDLKNLNETYGEMLNTDKLITELDKLNSYETNDSIMENVLQQERADLNMRMQNMNDTVDTSKRILLLNESDRLRTADYNSMLYYFVMMIVIVSIIAVIKNVFKFLPSALFELLIIVVVCTFLYLIYIKYVGIVNRDIINYNEVAVPNPDNVALTDQQISSIHKKNAGALGGGGSLMNLQPVKCDNKSESRTTTPMMFTTPMSFGDSGYFTTPMSSDIEDPANTENEQETEEPPADVDASELEMPYTTPGSMTTPGRMVTTPTLANEATPGQVVNVNLDADAVKALLDSSRATTLSSASLFTTPKKSGFTLMNEAKPNSFFEYSNYSAL
jgi:hypothetical protein